MKTGLLDSLLERGLLPDFLIRFGIRRLNRLRIAQETRATEEAQQQHFMEFLRRLRSGAIALEPDKANEQHYELPTELFLHVLGKRQKYSCCYWGGNITSLDDAEAAMLELTVARAHLQDGQTILDLGCGWGALSLFLAERFPNSRITAVSNSRTQREFIEQRASEEGLTNNRALVRDIADFAPEGRVDRIVSVEMLEHVRNHEELFARMASWLKPKGLAFIHVFSNVRFAYPFEATGPTDWMARYFFTGGLMPADNLFLYHQKDLALLDHWHVDGAHYQKTLEAWLRNMDRQKQVIMPILARTYGQEDAGKWWVRWRVFFMACAELFGTNRGREWIVSHYLFTRNPHLSDGD